MDDQNSPKDHRKTKNRGPVEPLAKDEISDPGDENDPKTRPDGIDQAHRHDRKRKRQKIKRHAISHHDDHRRHGPCELLTGLKRRRSHRFSQNRENQI